MPTVLGAEWASPPVVVEVDDESVIRLARVELALAHLSEVLTDQPPPQVHVEVEPADLAGIVTAVNGLKPGATADDIGAAVARALNVPRDNGDELVTLMQGVRDALELLAFRLQGLGAGGGGGPVNFPTTQVVTGDVGGPVVVSDDYQSGEVLPDQTGAGAALTFTFASPVNLVVVFTDGAVTDICRVDPFGGTPTAILGIPVGDEAPSYLPITTTSVKVFAPAAVVVSVSGFRRA